MKTSFEFQHKGRKVKAEYEQTRKLNTEHFKVFNYRVLKDDTWLYQGTLTFPVKATKKQIIENAGHVL